MRPGVKPLLFFVVVSGGLLWTYWATRQFGFLDIDSQTSVLFPRVVAPVTLDNVGWLLTHPIDFNWTPLTWYSHMIDHRLFGPVSGAHHLSNVVYHAATATSVYVFLATATGKTWRSVAVALIFAFHPLRVESVAWVVERKDTLSGLLGMLCLCAYTQYAHTQRLRWYAAAWLAFVASLLSKAMLVTLPCLLLVLDYWPLQRTRGFAPNPRAVSNKQLLLEKLAFLPPAAGVTYMARHGVNYTTASNDPLTLAQRVANAVYSVAQYMRKTIAPTDLSFWYPHPYLPPTGGRGLDALTLGASAALLVLIACLCILQRRKRPYLITGFCWFAGTLVPTLGVYFQAGRQGMADRFSYFPSIGLAIALVWTLAEWRPATMSVRRHAITWATLLVLSVVGMAYQSRIESARWRDIETLYADVLIKNPDNTHIHYLLGTMLLQRGALDAGLAHLRRAATLTPSWDDLVTGLADALRNAGRMPEALHWYRQAYTQSPELNHTRINLATALAMSGQYPEASALLREAIVHNPRSVGAHINLGMTLAAEGKLSEAKLELDRALALDPHSQHAARLSERISTALSQQQP